MTAFACPYGVGASGILRGPRRVDYVPLRGAPSRVRTRRIADSSGRGTFYALTVAVARLPGHIVVRTATGARIVADL